MIADLGPDHVDGCVEVVRALPEWFGYPGALEGVAKAVATQRGFVDLVGGQIIGFVTTNSTFDECLEITYLAVHSAHRRLGIGRELVIAVRDSALERHIPSISLLTLGPASKSPYYADTVSFYRALGFWRTNELYLSTWGGAPTLVMTAATADLAR